MKKTKKLDKNFRRVGKSSIPVMVYHPKPPSPRAPRKTKPLEGQKELFEAPAQRPPTPERA